MADNEFPNIEEEMMPEDETLREEGESIMAAFSRYQKQAYEEARLAWDALISDEVKDHSREAVTAFKKSFKVLLEEIADSIEVPEEDDAQEPPRPSTTGPTKVKVDVS